MRKDEQEMEVALELVGPRGARRPDAVADEELLARVGDGDRGAFDVLYRRYARAVLGLALRRLGEASLSSCR